MPGRTRRTHYDFSLGSFVGAMEHPELLRQADAQLNLAIRAMKDAERLQAIARVESARELISEARRRGDQLRLWT